MVSGGNGKIGRNAPCPCGSGKKYKRCCLEQEALSDSLWAQQKNASDQLTEDIMRFARHKFNEQISEAWQDFHLTDLPVPIDEDSHESQIFLPYFLFQWDPQRPRTGRKVIRRGGIVARWYELERGKKLSEMERLVLDQATSQPLSFYEVLRSEPGQSVGLRDILIGAEAEVIEHTASQLLRPGDIVYGQLWNVKTISTFGFLAPACIPPSWKAEVIALRKKLQKKIAKQNRALVAEDLALYADRIRRTYLTIRDGLNRPPRLANTDGEPLVFHTLTFSIESAETAFEALAPLAFGQSKEELLEEARFGKNGKLNGVELDWRKRGNARIPSWDNTILGHIQISGRSLVVEVNSENRARRLRAEIEKRLGPSAKHESTTAQTIDEMRAKTPKRSKAQARKHNEFVAALLRDPEARNRIQEMIQIQTEDWVHQKIPALGGRTPLEAVRDPDGREIVESLLLDWERRADEGAYQPGLRPDFNPLRKLLGVSSLEP